MITKLEIKKVLVCPSCGGNKQCGIDCRKPPTYYCDKCKKEFSSFKEVPMIPVDKLIEWLKHNSCPNTDLLIDKLREEKKKAEAGK